MARSSGITSNSRLTFLRKVTNPGDMVQIQITDMTLRRLKDNSLKVGDDIVTYEEMINNLLDLFEQRKLSLIK